MVTARYTEPFIPSGSTAGYSCYSTRQLVSIYLSDKVGRDMSFDYARRVGTRSNTSNRNIVIRLHSFSDKNEVLRCCQNTAYVFVNFHTEPNYLVKDSIEKVHTAYMKNNLNVTKFASNMCMYIELRRFPILHNAWSMTTKYWLRLCTGTGNTYWIMLTAFSWRTIICGYKIYNIYYLEMVSGIFGYALKMRMHNFIEFLDCV